jgi:phytoene synthase
MVTLEESYRACREVVRRSGTSFFWASALLPAVKRPHVHALYAFCRVADDIVDGPGTVDGKRTALTGFGERFLADLAAGCSADPVLRGVVHTVRAFGLPRPAFERFLRAMAMDLEVSSYATWDALRGYMDGSAAVVGELLLPILEPVDEEAAMGPARALGEAFQLTNFLRDVGEDLGRGRVYVPVEDLDRFGVEVARQAVDERWVALMRFEVARCRELYREAEAGVRLLPGRSGQCVAAAHDLYRRILDRIEANGYDVFTRRARVPTALKLAIASKHVVA